MRYHRPLVLLFMILAIAFCATRLLADDTTPADKPAPEANESIGPLLPALMILFLVAVFVLLLGAGLAAGIVVCALAGALAAFGIFSSSMAVGFLRRSPASGLRAMFLQLGAVAGIPCGMAAAWLVSFLAHGHWSIAARLLVGGASGLVCGVIVGWLFNFAWGTTAAWILARYERRPQESR